jgi:glycogen debranching enzyme
MATSEGFHREDTVATETLQQIAAHETAREPLFPLFDISELPEGLVDHRDKLSPAERARLHDDEVVVAIQHKKLELPADPIAVEQILMWSSHANTPNEIGLRGPTVASVNLEQTGEPSRYERQHGRDDLIAADDVKLVFPQLMHATVVSLAESQGMIDEEFRPGEPYGFEKPGSIILVNFEPGDPLGEKFKDRKLWKNRFYGSADAPALFVKACANLQEIDRNYLHDQMYTATDGREYPMKHAFGLSVKWLEDRMDESKNGLIEYSNPYTDGKGMRNMGWKDSAEAIMHKNGEWANSHGGIAAIEIQAQAITALQKAAHIYRTALDDERRAQQLEERASKLLNFVVENGWVEDEHGGYFAMGWDGDEQGNLRRIETKSVDMHQVLRVLDMENPDHKEKAKKTIRTLASEEMLTRWGNRVMSNKEGGYGDYRYHCGVWPNVANAVAETMAMIGYYRLDRTFGALVTSGLRYFGCAPEHLPGDDSPDPELPDKDIYVYNKKYNEIYLLEQFPPLGQTWVATSEIGKQYRHTITPDTAELAEDQEFEQEIRHSIESRYGPGSV